MYIMVQCYTMEINKVNCKKNCRTVLERNTVPHIASAGYPAPRSSFGPGVTISTVCSQPSPDQIKDAASFKCLNNSFTFHISQPRCFLPANKCLCELSEF